MSANVCGMISHEPRLNPKMNVAVNGLRGEIRQANSYEDKAASAKLKVVLPLIPAIASYELEMETEGFMYKVWKVMKEVVRR